MDSTVLLIALPLVAGVIALVFAAIMAFRVVRAEAGNERMTEIGDAIRTGASAFLRTEYLALLPFVVVVVWPVEAASRRSMMSSTLASR